MSDNLPRHRPYRHDGALFQIGVKPMDIASWLDTGPDHAAFMRAKRERMTGRPPLFYAATPESLPAQAELLSVITGHLARYHATQFAVEHGTITDRIDGTVHRLGQEGREPMEIAAGMLEEDLILLQQFDDNIRIIAASNPYSSSGRIVSCVGRDMRFAHDPVPGLNEQLGPRIDRVLGHVKADVPVVRFNWVITAIGERLFPARSHEANVAASEAVARDLSEDFRMCGEKLWLRVERQTFVRLPETGALAFAIHTYSDPLSSLSQDEGSLSQIHKLLGEYSEDRLRYSAMLATREPVMRWIRERLAA